MTLPIGDDELRVLGTESSRRMVRGCMLRFAARVETALEGE